MANNFDSNFTRQLARVFLEKFESLRVLSKNVNTQLLANKFSPKSGDTVDFKRPTDYKSNRTPEGDVSGLTADNIITGKASGIVQNYFTVFVDYDEADEAIKMDQIDQLLEPMATRIVTDLEIDFAAFMMINSGLLAGTYGSPVATWDDVARAGAIMESSGIPKDGDWNYTVNPFTQTSLASDQRSLGAGGSAGELISKSHKMAIITDQFAGMKVMSATTLATLTSHSVADRVGALNSNPDVTYVTAKDTMTQDLDVNAFGANLQVRAGEVIQITGVNRLNLSTRQPMIDETGGVIVFTGVVTTAVTLSGTGTGTIVISGPAIFEASLGNGMYNTVDVAPVATDVLTLLGALSTLQQPNLFWHKQAFGIGSVPIKKLNSTDTVGTTEDGLQIRVSKGVGFLENNQKVRFDFRPAYAVFNPFFAGQGFGTP
jgi:hypothetical protein